MAGVYVHTLGCPKNEADSAGLARRLLALGIPVTLDPSQATSILINTCGFIEDATRESIDAVLDAALGYPDKPLFVTGCAVQRYGPELTAEIPEVTGWFGLGETAELLDALAAHERRSGLQTVGASSEAPAPSGLSYVYIKISDGCDHACSFCAIPGIKGPYHSLSVEEILEQVEPALTRGARELVLVGQDTALWTDGQRDLVGLLDLLGEDPRVTWIRTMYLQPEHLSPRLLAGMAANQKVCRYLDIPFQHASSKVLRAMKRGGTAASFLELLGKARRRMPEVSVRSTFIVGFPGETEEDFAQLLEFVEAAGFDYAGTFAYSPEEGTPAAALPGRVEERVARRRLSRLGDILSRQAEGRNRALIGTRLEVMIDALGEDAVEYLGTALGRTRGQAPEVDGITILEGPLPSGISRGDVVDAIVTDAVGYDLVARCHA